MISNKINPSFVATATRLYDTVAASQNELSWYHEESNDISGEMLSVARWLCQSSYDFLCRFLKSVKVGDIHFAPSNADSYLVLGKPYSIWMRVFFFQRHDFWKLVLKTIQNSSTNR
jgi:hypothetical protein